MREIKFRAWHLDEGMLYFDLETFKIDYHDQYGNLVLYTGLKDKNEVEIYFGDIVSKYHDDDSEDKDIRVVEQIEGHTEIGCFSYYEDSLDFKVIGNIHENPELR